MADFSEMILVSVFRVQEDLKFLDPEKTANYRNVGNYFPIWRHMSEDLNVHQHYHKNLKPQIPSRAIITLQTNVFFFVLKDSESIPLCWYQICVNKNTV
jgi:hypothetical protein